MKFSIEHSVFDKYGSISFGFMLASGLGKVQDFSQMYHQIQSYSDLAKSRIREFGRAVEIPQVKEWQDIYGLMGAGKSKISSIESLLQYVSDNGKIPAIIPLVDMYNAVSCKNCLPMAGYDADNIVGGSITLRTASKGEPFTPLGLRQIEKTKNGEVVYSDDEGVICRYWNNKDSDRTKLGAEIDRAVFIIDGAPSISSELLMQAISDLKDLLHIVGVNGVVFGMVDSKNALTEIFY